MDRERVWMATIFSDNVTVRRYAVLAPGEDLTEYPPTATMPLAEWQARHLEYDCTIDGMPLHPRPGVGAPVEPAEA